MTSSLKNLLIVLLTPAVLAAAQHDNDVEWYGVFSYPGYRSPLYPARGQSFTVELRVFKGDITGARVRAWDGSEHFYGMAWNRNDGSSYDIYRSASIPLVVVVSLANSDFRGYQLGLPLPGDWFEVLNGDREVYGGKNVGNGGKITVSAGACDGFNQSAFLTIPRMGVLVFARKPLEGEPEPGFLRGNCNGDRVVDISDAIQTLGVLFLGSPAGDCLAACDANADGRVDISDGIYTLTFLFGGGPAPSESYPACGINPGSLACTTICREN